MSEWFFNEKILTEDDIPDKSIAFLYVISHIESNKWYIGRKNLFRKVTKTVNGKKKKSLISSDWHNYWSSSDYLKSWIKTEGSDKFKRTILIFVESASATIYGEESLLYMTGGMFNPLCMNGHIRTKIMRKWFENKESNLHNRLIKSIQDNNSLLK